MSFEMDDENVNSQGSEDLNDSQDDLGSKMMRLSIAQRKNMSTKVHYRFQKEVMNKLNSLEKVNHLTQNARLQTQSERVKNRIGQSPERHKE